jgi:4-alpha-glucanotransferase
MNLQFYLRFFTQFGESLWISGNTPELGMGDARNAVSMEYLNDEFWHLSLHIPRKTWPGSGILYKYYLKKWHN